MHDIQSSTRPEVRFPSYLLDHVFIHLPLKDLYNCQLVCREWKSAISSYPSLRPKLFTALPSTAIPTTRNASSKQDTQFTLHPVFSAIEQDWSIILSTPVFSHSDTLQPQPLHDYTVRENMATIPALQEISVWVKISGVLNREASSKDSITLEGNVGSGNIARRRRAEEEKNFKINVRREEGVRVMDVWDTFLELMENTRGVAPKDRTLRETFMAGNYTSFTWGLNHNVAQTSTSTSSQPPVTTTSATSTTLFEKWFFGIVYRGYFSDELSYERKRYAAVARKSLGPTKAIDSGTPQLPLRSKKPYPRLWKNTEARRYEGKFDMSF